MAENVLVVARTLLFPTGEPVPRGFVSGDLSRYRERFDAARFVERAGAETDPGSKQLIPYAVITWGGKVLCLTRKPRGGDPRLRGRASIGIGGHVSPPDAPASRSPGWGWSAVERALEREIAEEVRLAAPSPAKVLGIINDDGDDVGRVHFGIVFHVELEAPGVEVRENDRLEGGLESPEDVARIAGERLESWSRLLFEALWPDALDRRAAERPSARGRA